MVQQIGVRARVEQLGRAGVPQTSPDLSVGRGSSRVLFVSCSAST